MTPRAPHQLLDALGVALAAERAALISGDADAMAAAAQGKAACLPELRSALGALPAAERRRVTARLGERVAQLQRFNELNGAVLASRLAINRARLEALLSAAGSGTYGASGQVDAVQSIARPAAVSA